MAVNKFLKKRNINNRNKFQQKKKESTVFRVVSFYFFIFFWNKKGTNNFGPKKKSAKEKGFLWRETIRIEKKKKKDSGQIQNWYSAGKTKKKKFQKKKGKSKRVVYGVPGAGNRFSFLFFLIFFMLRPNMAALEFFQSRRLFLYGGLLGFFFSLPSFFFCSMDPTIDPLDIQRKTLEHGLPTDFGKKK